MASIATRIAEPIAVPRATVIDSIAETTWSVSSVDGTTSPANPLKVTRPTRAPASRLSMNSIAAPCAAVSRFGFDVGVAHRHRRVEGEQDRRLRDRHGHVARRARRGEGSERDSRRQQGHGDVAAHRRRARRRGTEQRGVAHHHRATATAAQQPQVDADQHRRGDEPDQQGRPGEGHSDHPPQEHGGERGADDQQARGDRREQAGDLGRLSLGAPFELEPVRDAANASASAAS